VLRLDWSPDGQYIVTAHAMNNSGPTAQIIERGNQNGWQTKKDFVGHRKAITVVVRIFDRHFILYSVGKSHTNTTTICSREHEPMEFLQTHVDRFGWHETQGLGVGPGFGSQSNCLGARHPV